jgi:protein SCO1/2
MAQRHAASRRDGDSTGLLDIAFWLMAGIALVLVTVTVAGLLLLPSGPSGGASAGSAPGAASPSASASPVVDVASFLDPVPTAAPTIRLTDPNDQPLDLASYRGTPVFVFFGYTHCADICPATIGTVGLALEAFGGDARAIFVSVDPERDTTAWLREYVRFMPAAFTPVTGTPAEIRATADAWGVRYAREATGPDGDYEMSHTADVFLVDASGTRRATFPFGTSSEEMTAVLRAIALTPGQAAGPTAEATTRPTAAPSIPPTATPAEALAVEVVSSSVWARVPGPIILSLSASGARVADPQLRPTVQLVTSSGDPAGTPVDAIAVQPPGVDRVFYVAAPIIPAPGAWRLEVTAGPAVGSAAITALDPGTTPLIGTAAPTVPTPTLADAGGLALAVTTDPAPDLRLSRTSTADALAAHRPFVLIVDSTRFRVTQVCGRAIVMARYLLDRWHDVAFVHLEPFRYSVIANTAVLDGTLSDPVLTGPADAWGTGGQPWGPLSMPWAFVVDGSGIVRATYQGLMGTDDIDVILALIAAGH